MVKLGRQRTNNGHENSSTWVKMDLWMLLWNYLDLVEIHELGNPRGRRQHPETPIAFDTSELGNSL
jgi:hypothetical protein